MMYKVPQKKAPLRQKAYKNKAYLKHMHSSEKSCVICGSREIELHHIRTKEQTGRIDNQVIPVCPLHHRGKFSPHGFDSAAFYEQYPKELLLQLAEEFFNEYLEVAE